MTESTSPLRFSTVLLGCIFLLVAGFAGLMIDRFLYGTTKVALHFTVSYPEHTVNVLLTFLNDTDSSVQLVSLDRATNAHQQMRTYDLHYMTMNPGDTLLVSDGLTSRDLDHLPTVFTLWYSLPIEQYVRRYDFQLTENMEITIKYPSLFREN